MPNRLDTDRLKRLAEATSKPAPSAQLWPSREPTAPEPEEGRGPDGQITMRGPMSVIERFRAMCKADRRTYLDMLDILMNEFEGKSRG
jgi:hypothetical protein